MTKVLKQFLGQFEGCIRKLIYNVYAVQWTVILHTGAVVRPELSRPDQG